MYKFGKNINMYDLKNLNFRTIIEPLTLDFKISYLSNIMFLGSCFTENIGFELKKSKFNIDINPFGILYNPLSIKNTLDFLIEKQLFSEKDIFYFNERWNSFYHHSKFSNPNKEEMIQTINDRIKSSSKFLKKTDVLFVTFGTSYVYEYITSEKIVSNCHKIPSKKFKRRLLNIQEITDAYSEIIKRINKINKNLKFVFTISPIRHIKDGLAENNLSKSILRLAIENIINNNLNCYYFPSYEIMIDDLRDYRFYEQDLLHPNKTAIEYILNYFKNTFFSNNTFSIYNKIMQVNKAIKHKAFNPKSEEYSNFLDKQIEKINLLALEYDYIDFSEELLSLKNKKSNISVGLFKP